MASIALEYRRRGRDGARRWLADYIVRYDGNLARVSLAVGAARSKLYDTNDRVLGWLTLLELWPVVNKARAAALHDDRRKRWRTEK